MSLKKYIIIFIFFFSFLCKYECTSDSNQEVDILIDEGIGLMNIGDWNGAQSKFEKALRLSKEVEYTFGEAGALHYLGIMQRKFGDYEKAEEYQYKALHIFQKRKEANKIANLPGSDQSLRNSIHWEADCYDELSIIYQFTGRIDESIKYNEKAIELFKEIEDQKGLTKALMNGSVTYVLIDDLEEAEKRAGQALKLSQQDEDILGIAICIQVQGYVDYLRNDYISAKIKFEECLNYFRQANDPEGEMVSLNFLGIVHSRIQEFEFAIEHFESSLEISFSLGDRSMQMILYQNMASSYVQQGNYSKASEEYLILSQMYKDLNDDLSYRYYKNLSTMQKAEAESQINQYEESSKLFVETMEGFSKLYEQEVFSSNKRILMYYRGYCDARSDFELGSSNFEKMEYIKSIEYFDKSAQKFSNILIFYSNAEEIDYIKGYHYYALLQKTIVQIHKDGKSEELSEWEEFYSEKALFHFERAGFSGKMIELTIRKRGSLPLCSISKTEYLVFLHTLKISNLHYPKHIYRGNTNHIIFTITVDPSTLHTAGDYPPLQFCFDDMCSLPIRLDPRYSIREVKIPIEFDELGRKKYKIFIKNENEVILGDLSVCSIDDSFLSNEGYIEIEIRKTFRESIRDNWPFVVGIPSLFISLITIWKLFHRRHKLRIKLQIEYREDRNEIGIQIVNEGITAKDVEYHVETDNKMFEILKYVLYTFNKEKHTTRIKFPKEKELSEGEKHNLTIKAKKKRSGKTNVKITIKSLKDHPLKKTFQIHV